MNAFRGSSLKNSFPKGGALTLRFWGEGPDGGAIVLTAFKQQQENNAKRTPDNENLAI